MGKASRRKPAQTAQGGDVHARIIAEAAACRNAPRLGVRDADELPALSSLMDSARAALGQAIPAHFVHEGKTYFLRVSLGLLRLKVFDAPGASEPMACAMAGSYEEFGHTPSH